jgi:hypothetical protein
MPGRLAGAAVGLLALAGTAVLAAGAAAPSPRFSAPRRIIASTPNVPSAVSGSGEAVTLRPGSGPGPALQLASAHGRVRTVGLATTIAGYDNPSVAISDSGVLAAVWDTSSTAGTTPDVVEMAVGTFGAPPTSASVLSAPEVAVSGERAFVTPAGTAVAVWNQSDGAFTTVRASIVPAGGAPRAVTIAANETFVGGGLDGAGRVVLIEQDGGTFAEQTISPNGSTVSPAHDFAVPTAIADAAGIAGELGVLFDAAGAQLYSWRAPGRNQKLEAVWRSSAGAFGAIQALGRSADLGDGRQQVALSSSGHAVAVLSAGGTGPLRVRFASELNHFGRSQRVGAPGRYADMPSLSINGAGRALLAWLDSPASGRGTTKSRAVVAVSRGMHFSSPAQLPVGTGLGSRYLGDEPLTAAAPGGRPELITYGGSRGSTSVGQIAFLTG